MNLTISTAISNLSSPSKRKASSFDNDDAENLDPVLFLSPKKLKSPDGSSVDTLQKPVNFFLTKAPPSPNDFSTLKSVVASPRRPILQVRSPAPRLNTTVSKTPSTAPAGRSPTRKRIGILNRRKTGSPFTRVDPPKFGASSGLGFSIDAALSGTISSYGKRQPSVSRENELPVSLHEREAKSSWFFDIHEDTPEELATNLMEHSTCTLDISSDEESAARMKDERGKENVPPLDDVSQTRITIGEIDARDSSMMELKASVRASRRRREIDDGACDIDRAPLGEMLAADFYAEGCDGSSVFIIPAESDLTNAEGLEEAEEAVPMTFDFIAEVKGKGKDIDVDSLMQKDDFVSAPKAALLEPIEKVEGFEVWVS